MSLIRTVTRLSLATLFAACAGPDGDAAPSDTAAAVPRSEGRTGGGSETGRDPARDTVPAPPVAGAQPGERRGWTADPIRVPDAGDGIATVSAVRIGAHEGFDRLVIEFEEAGLPGYLVERIGAPAVQCGSGFVLEMAGEELIQVRMEPARAHTEEGQPTLIERRWKVGLPVISEVALTCDFEGQVELVAGVPTSSRHRVLELSDPARLVIDITRD